MTATTTTNNLTHNDGTFRCKTPLVASVFGHFTDAFPEARLTEWDLKLLTYLDALPRNLASFSIGCVPGTGLLANNSITCISWYAEGGRERGTGRFFNLSPPFQKALDTAFQSCEKRSSELGTRSDASDASLGQLRTDSDRDSTTSPAGTDS